MNAATHQQRIDDLLGRLSETTTRFGARLESAGPRAELAENGWTPAQIAVHVAMVNENLASVIDGSLPGATPPAAGFQERAWSDVVRNVPARNEAPPRFHPPAQVSLPDALTQFRASAAHLTRAIEGLAEDRGDYCITNKAVGTISLRQAGDFAIAHMIRHNQQMKRVLEVRNTHGDQAVQRR
jgi:hypothetical protein